MCYNRRGRTKLMKKSVEQLLKEIEISDEEQMKLIDEELEKEDNSAEYYNPFLVIKENKNFEILEEVLKEDLEAEKKEEC